MYKRQERYHQTILLVTHNEEIAQMAERITRHLSILDTDDPFRHLRDLDVYKRQLDGKKSAG